MKFKDDIQKKIEKNSPKNSQNKTGTRKSTQTGTGKNTKGVNRTGDKSAAKKGNRRNKRNWKKTVIFAAVVICILALLLAGILFFKGCGGQKLEDATQSTVTVAKNGKISQLLIEALPSGQYSESDLKNTVTQWIDEYVKQHDKNAVVMDGLEVKEEVAKLRINYSSVEDYKAFNNVDFFTGTVEEAIAAGYEFPNIFINKGGEEVSFTKIRSSCQDEKVIIIQEPLNVLTPDAILYVSSNMEILDGQNAKLENDTMITYENGQTVTQNYGIVIYNSK